MKFALSIDEFVEELYQADIKDESPAGHYIVFDAESKEGVAEKIAEAMKPLFKTMVYESDDYGYPKK